MRSNHSTQIYVHFQSEKINTNFAFKKLSHFIRSNPESFLSVRRKESQRNLYIAGENGEAGESYPSPNGNGDGTPNQRCSVCGPYE